MSKEPREGDPRRVRTVRPGDQVLRMRTRRARLPLIERKVSSPLLDAVWFFRELAVGTPIAGMIGALVVLVLLAPIPVYLFERGAEDAQMTSYWVGLWWAASAFSTVGHSDIAVNTVGGRVVGSIYTVVSVGLFFGSVISAFSSYFLLTWRKPTRQLVVTINYYLQRVDELSVEELDDLDDMTRGLLLTAKERAEAEKRKGLSPDEEPAPH